VKGFGVAIARTLVVADDVLGAIEILRVAARGAVWTFRGNTWGKSWKIWENHDT